MTTVTPGLTKTNSILPSSVTTAAASNPPIPLLQAQATAAASPSIPAAVVPPTAGAQPSAAAKTDKNCEAPTPGKPQFTVSNFGNKRVLVLNKEGHVDAFPGEKAPPDPFLASINPPRDLVTKPKVLAVADATARNANVQHVALHTPKDPNCKMGVLCPLKEPLPKPVTFKQ